MNDMPKPLIHILPPQLANQIAAGEVVERPASVVKELIENSLDAGANQIYIEIEKGGAQLIRIRDNGCGIAKGDLELALARHATSKITSLEDLENILSLGFRGEALASISSVARLTLTSRPAYQPEAWQAYAQGREMVVELKPASHPVGTTIDVADLFFNTPARRKFLRTDKTEFTHIDEVVKRIALAKPNVTFTLTHNGKKVRFYKSITNQQIEQQQKRIATICGDAFMQQAMHIDWQHNDLHLYGWVGSAQAARLQNDLSYSYVNGRMMRDKTINHAIRQAYGDRLAKDYYPSFILFLDIAPNQVDVNVHPAKHEVRFHQSRLVHDFIYQGVLSALEQNQQDFIDQQSQQHQIAEEPSTYGRGTDTNRQAAGANIYAQRLSTAQTTLSEGIKQTSYSPPTKPHISSNAQKWYGELLSPHSELDASLSKRSNTLQTLPTENEQATIVSNKALTIVPNKISDNLISAKHYQTLSLVQQRALLVKQGETFSLILLDSLIKLRLRLQLTKIDSQTLLIPLNLTLNDQQTEQWQHHQAHLQQLGFEIEQKQWQGTTRLTLQKVPRVLREQNLQQLLLGALATNDNLIDYFCQHCQLPAIQSFTEAISLLSEIEQFKHANNLLQNLCIPVDFSIFLDKKQ